MTQSTLHTKLEGQVWSFAYSIVGTGSKQPANSTRMDIACDIALRT
jgi:hypothetical protein